MAIKNIKNGSGPFVRRNELAGLIAEVLADRNGDPTPAPINPATHCLVQNDSGEARDHYCVLKLGDPLIKPADDANDYEFGLPMHSTAEIDADDLETFCVLQDPASTDSELVTAIYAGVTFVRLTGDTGKKFATTKDGETSLEAADSGPCTILYDPGPADEERIARVRIGGGSGGSDAGGSDGSGAGCGCSWQAIDGDVPDAFSFIDPILRTGVVEVADRDGGTMEFNAPDATLVCQSDTPPEDDDEGDD